MNRHFVRSFVALLIASTCQASVLVGLTLPFDDAPSKQSLWTDAATSKQIESDRKSYYALEEQLRTLPESKLQALFGAPKDVRQLTGPPAGYALPVHHHSAVGFSGLGYRGDMRAYFLPIADLGGLLVFPFGDRDFTSAVVLYLKTDSEFVALHAASDYPARRAWEVSHTDRLRKYIQEALSK
jgi:hypothetical protein